MSMYIDLTLTYTKRTRGCTTETTRTARFDEESTRFFASLHDFTEDYAAIFKDAQRLGKEGEQFILSLSSGDWDGEHFQTYNLWVARGCDYVGVDDNNKPFIYLLPEPQYTRAEWDMMLYPDPIKSLAEANV